MAFGRIIIFVVIGIGVVVGASTFFKHSSTATDYPPFVYIPTKAVEPAPEVTAPPPEETKVEIKEETLPAPLPQKEKLPEAPPTTFPEPPASDKNEAVDAKDAVKRADDLMRGDSVSGKYIMSIHTPSWERTLTLQVYGLGRNKMFIRILTPAKEAGIGTLRIDNEMWNYLPDIEKTLKIPPSMMLQPWMGSDFANDDLVKESSIVNDYDHQLVSITSLENDVAYKIELTPKATSAVVWGKRIQWIRLDDFVPLKEEYYDDKGELIKILTYSDIGQVSDRTIPRTWTMRSFIKPGFTTSIQLKDVEYNLPLENNIFTLQNLKKIQ